MDSKNLMYEISFIMEEEQFSTKTKCAFCYNIYVFIIEYLKIFQATNELRSSKAARYKKAYDVIYPKIPLKLSFRQVPRLSHARTGFSRNPVPCQKTLDSRSGSGMTQTK
jgi:hypothetical protein